MRRTPFAHIAVLVAFLINSLGVLPASAQEIVLPKPGVMVSLSPPMNPPVLKGIKVHADNPFRFDFILDKGDDVGAGHTQSVQSELKAESEKLIKYFLASLTIPEKDLWVNLSPYEKDRIIPESFGVTEMGRDLLAEDYMLKQITASLIYPEGETGKKFWKRIYEEAQSKYHTTNIPVNTFNKVWIVPEKAMVYENVKAGTAYVVESKLKVMLEQDYLSLDKHNEGAIHESPVPNKNVNQLGSQIVREIVIPELTREVNEGKNFAQLRQVYNSLILATWYKKKIKDSILAQVYADKSKIQGVNIDDPKEKEQIYQQYLKAFKKGVYNYIKDEPDPITNQTIPKKYFSGGVQLFGFSNSAMSVTNIFPVSILKKTSLSLFAITTILNSSPLEAKNPKSQTVQSEYQSSLDPSKQSWINNNDAKHFLDRFRALNKGDTNGIRFRNANEFLTAIANASPNEESFIEVLKNYIEFGIVRTAYLPYELSKKIYENILKSKQGIPIGKPNAFIVIVSEEDNNGAGIQVLDVIKALMKAGHPVLVRTEATKSNFFNTIHGFINSEKKAYLLINAHGQNDNLMGLWSWNEADIAREQPKLKGHILGTIINACTIGIGSIDDIEHSITRALPEKKRNVVEAFATMTGAIAMGPKSPIFSSLTTISLGQGGALRVGFIGPQTDPKNLRKINPNVHVEVEKSVVGGSGSEPSKKVNSLPGIASQAMAAYENFFPRLDMRVMQQTLFNYYSMIRQKITVKKPMEIVLYGASGADLSNVLVATGAKSFYMVDRKLKDVLPRVRELWKTKVFADNGKELNPDFIKSSDYVGIQDYVREMEKKGWFTQPVAHEEELIVKGIIGQLLSLGLTRDDVSFGNIKGVAYLEFDKEIDGINVKRRFNFIDGDISIADTFIDHLPKEGIDVYFQNAALDLSMFFGDYAKPILDRLNGYLIIDPYDQTQKKLDYLIFGVLGHFSSTQRSYNPLSIGIDAPHLSQNGNYGVEKLLFEVEKASQAMKAQENPAMARENNTEIEFLEVTRDDATLIYLANELGIPIGILRENNSKIAPNALIPIGTKIRLPVFDSRYIQFFSMASQEFPSFKRLMDTLMSFDTESSMYLINRLMHVLWADLSGPDEEVSTFSFDQLEALRSDFEEVAGDRLDILRAFDEFVKEVEEKNAAMKTKNSVINLWADSKVEEAMIYLEKNGFSQLVHVPEQDISTKEWITDLPITLKVYQLPNGLRIVQKPLIHGKSSIDIIKELAQAKRPGIVPIFFDSQNSSYYYELDLRSVSSNYKTLVADGGMELTDELRKKISDVVEDSLRFSSKHWFVHGHLHLENILVRINEQGTIEDLKIIDFKLLSSLDLAEHQSLREYQVNRNVKDLSSKDFSNLTLEWFNFSRRNFQRADFRDSVLYFCDFKGADMTDSLFGSKVSLVRGGTFDYMSRFTDVLSNHLGIQYLAKREGADQGKIDFFGLENGNRAMNALDINKVVGKLRVDESFQRAVDYFNSMIPKHLAPSYANLTTDEIIDLYEIPRGDRENPAYTSDIRQQRINTVNDLLYPSTGEHFDLIKLVNDISQIQEQDNKNKEVFETAVKIYTDIVSQEIFVNRETTRGLPGFNVVWPAIGQGWHAADGHHRLAWFLVNYYLIRNGYDPFYFSDKALGLKYYHGMHVPFREELAIHLKEQGNVQASHQIDNIATDTRDGAMNAEDGDEAHIVAYAPGKVPWEKAVELMRKALEDGRDLIGLVGINDKKEALLSIGDTDFEQGHNRLNGYLREYHGEKFDFTQVMKEYDYDRHATVIDLIPNANRMMERFTENYYEFHGIYEGDYETKPDLYWLMRDELILVSRLILEASKKISSEKAKEYENLKIGVIGTGVFDDDEQGAIRNGQRNKTLNVSDIAKLPLSLEKKTGDKAMSNTGGIDLSSKEFVKTQNAGEGIKFHMDPAMLAQLQNAPGFYPVIVSIEPLTDLRGFLGICQTSSTNSLQHA